MDYSQFSVTDFVLDEYFQQWVKFPDADHEIFWENFLLQHPEKKEMLDQAKALLLAVDFHKTPVESIPYQRILERIQASLENERKVYLAPNRKTSSIKQSIWFKMAATVLLVFGFSLTYWLINKESYQTYTTQYGQTREVVLPDGSVVMLNANSVLQLPADWKQKEEREVWLQGEAYFKVAKVVSAKESDPTSFSEKQVFQKFMVHTDQLDIEVLGTEFNVNDRRNKTQVVLNSGKVQLTNKINEASPKLRMVPGEMVELSEQKKIFTKKLVNPTQYSSWKEHKLIIEDLTLAEIAQLIEDNYGIQVTFEGIEANKEKFRGILPSGNVEVLLKAFSKSYDLQVRQENSKIIFHRNNKKP